MPRSLKLTFAACFTLFAAGCGEKAGPDEATETDPELTGTTVEPTTGGTTIVEPPTSSSEAGESETIGATETIGESETVGETETTGEALPVACDMGDPSVSAAFSVALGAWPEQSDANHQIDVMCTIDAMPLEGDTIVHALTCDDAGTPRPVELRVALSTVGAVTWSEGDSVRLESSRLTEVDFGVDELTVRLWAADETLLLIGVDSTPESGANFAPLTAVAQFPCGEEEFDGPEVVPFEILFGFEGAEVAIVHRHRDVLPIDGGAVFAIDVGEATTNYCCHYTRKYKVLIRRVMPL